MAMITNIQHFLDDGSETKLPPRAAKLRDFFGQVFRVSTATPDDFDIASGLRCRRRVHRRRCEGTILIRCQDVPGPFIFWLCPYCGDEGRIEGYRRSPYDLSRNQNLLGSEKSDLLVNVELTLDEYEAWPKGDFVPYDPDSERLVYLAIYFEDVVELEAFESDLDILRDCIAADANHERSRKRQRLMKSVFCKVSAALDAALEVDTNL